MSTNPNPLFELKKLGQSIWLDSIRRGHILTGELQKMIDADGITGETANPSIFEKAIAGSHDYDDAVRKLVSAGKNALEIYETLAIQDVQMACDVFRPVYDATKGADGFVSIEVSPKLAHDTAGTIAEAKRFFKAVHRPNVMIKIPGTKEGVPAIEECLYAGLNINITLLFAVPAYEEVAWAYVRALERRAAEGLPVDRVASVASFFVSRIDTLADKLLSDKIRATQDAALIAKLEALGGKAAIANAKMAYALFKQIFSDPRFVALKKKGARVQRPLWASTSTKNPDYPETLYVDTLIGPDTVNTLPPETIEAFRAHGTARATIEEDMDGARQVLRDLEAAGVSMTAVTAQVLDEGVVKFDQALEQLLQSIEAKIVAAVSERQSAVLGDYADEVNENIAAAEQNQVAARIWKKDAALWKNEPAHQAIIQNALGWLTVTSEMHKHLDELAGIRHGDPQGGVQVGRIVRHGRQQPVRAGLPRRHRQRAGLPAALCARHDRPGQHPRGRTKDQAKANALYHCEQIRRHDRNAVALQILCRKSARAEFRRDHRRRLGAGKTRRAQKDSAASSSIRPTSADAIPRCRTLAWCRRP